MSGIIQQFLERSQNQGSRSTVISPIGWLLGILLAGVAMVLRYNGPAWVLVVLMLGFAVLIGVFYGHSYSTRTDLLIILGLKNIHSPNWRLNTVKRATTWRVLLTYRYKSHNRHRYYHHPHAVTIRRAIDGSLYYSCREIYVS